MYVVPVMHVHNAVCAPLAQCAVIARLTDPSLNACSSYLQAVWLYGQIHAVIARLTDPSLNACSSYLQAVLLYGQIHAVIARLTDPSLNACSSYLQAVLLYGQIHEVGCTPAPYQTQHHIQALSPYFTCRG